MTDKKIISFSTRKNTADIPSNRDIVIVSKVDENVDAELNSYEDYDTGLTIKVPNGVTVLIYQNENIVDMGYSFETIVYEGNDQERDIVIKLFKHKEVNLELPVKVGRMTAVKTENYFIASSNVKNNIDTSTNIKNSSRRNFSLF